VTAPTSAATQGSARRAGWARERAGTSAVIRPPAILARIVPPQRLRPPARLAAAAAVVALAAGCGSQTAISDLPPAAEPSQAPPLTQRPAGRVLAVGAGPEGVAVDPRTGIVAVALRDPDRIALVDGRRARLLRSVAVPAAARHLQLAAPGGPVLVPAEKANRLATVALPGGRVRSFAVGRQPHDAAAAGGRLFAGNELGASVSVLEGGRVVHTFSVASQPGGVAPLDGGRAVAVVSVRERVLEVFDTRTYRRLGRVPAGVGPTHVVTDGANQIYVVDTTGDALLVFHLRPRLELTRRVGVVGTPYGLAYDAHRRDLWVTTTERNALVQLDGGPAPTTLRTYPAVRQADTVAVDDETGRVFVTGRVGGVLQLLDPPAG
jgi:DNA-binding beta-propeller fold protein YncE